RRRRLGVEERVHVVVPHHSSVCCLDDAGFERADEPAVGVVEVRGVGERQILHMLAVVGFDGGSGRLLVHASDIATNAPRRCLTDAMNVRRVVTGHNASGKSVFVSDEAVDPTTVQLMPSAEFHLLWGEDKTPQFPDDGSMPDWCTYFPPVGGFRF